MTRSWPVSLLMFACLTVGYGVVHVVVSTWGISVSQAIWPDSTPLERLGITEDGEALIQSYSSNSRVTFRKLDGTPVPETLGLFQKFASSATLQYLHQAEPRSWNVRIASFHDYQKPATCWYLIVPPNRASTGYFVGYDQISRRLVGYVGVNGFSAQPPTVDQSFPINTSENYAFVGSVASTQTPSPYSYSYSAEPNGNGLDMQYVPVANAAADAVWIRSQGTIYEIRLGARTVRAMLENRSDLLQLAQTTIVRDRKSYLQLLGRTETGLLIIDPESGTAETVPLEPVPRHGYESFYELNGGSRILVHHTTSTRHGRSHQHHRIFWLGEDGQTDRREELTLDFSYGLQLNPNTAFSLACPSPVVAFGALFIAPAFMPEESPETQTYSGRLMQFFADARGWFIVSLVTGILTGWACRRREREVFGSSNWLWPILVGACGWFGWMGYICLRPLPARLPHGQWLSAQPEPNRPLGTEIFA